MKTFVVDASVGAKWYFQEELQETAHRLFERAKKKEIKIVVPELFYIEMGNICWNRFQRQMLDAKTAIKVLDEVTALPLECYSDKELADVAAQNAIQYEVTVYDGLYIALAEVYVAPLVTADNGILKALKNRFDFILPLQELE